MSTDEGREKLMQDKPTGKRTSVTVGHIRAVREVVNKAKVLYGSAAMIKRVLDEQYSDLPPLKLHEVKRILRKFAGARYVKTNTRPPKALTEEY